MNLSVQIIILELEEFSVIDIKDVKSAYRRLQKIWHPDLHVGKDSLEEAKAWASQINNAYEVITEYIEINGNISNSKKFFGYEKINPEFTPRHSWRKKAFTPGFPDETVFEIFVKSSNILSVGYNPYTETLYMKFKDNAVYEYSKVPMFVLDDLLNAESHGKYAHRNIFYTYKYRICIEKNKNYKGPALNENKKFYLTIQ